MEKKTLSFNSNRRFGGEAELNSFDNRDFKVNKLKPDEQPEGIDAIAHIIRKVTGEQTDIMGWQFNHNNSGWICKPDSSCGIEVCTPVLNGWIGLKKLCQVLDAFSTNPKIKSDQRCSFHVHVDVRDLSDDDNSLLAKVLSYWVKSEMVFLSSVPTPRKKNKYCQQIGLGDSFTTDALESPNEVVKKFGTNKYQTVNTFHLVSGQRKTIEFRIMESDACLDSFLVKNWVRLLLHFVEMAKEAPEIKKFQKNDPWTGYAFLDVKDVFKLLKFDGEYTLSPGLTQTRNWFIARIKKNINTNLAGIWSEPVRAITEKQTNDLINVLGLDENTDPYLYPPSAKKEHLTYAEEFTE